MNYTFKLLIRNFVKRPILTLITFFGFTIGILASLLIYLWVFNELNHDKFHPEYDKIYRVLTLAKQGNEIVKSASSYQAIAKTLKADYPQIESATYLSFSSEDSPLFVNGGDDKIEARKCFVNDDFFDVFKGFRFIEGHSKSVFSDPESIVLSEKIARKLFGKESALGKKVISDKYDKKIYTVVGVVKIPLQSHIEFGYLASESYDKYNLHAWNRSYWVHTYIKLAEKAQIDDHFLARISNHLSRYTNKTDKLFFQPLDDIHLHSDYQSNSLDKNRTQYKYIWIFSGLALLILLMAMFNFSVLSIARSTEQAVEIGIQKVNGAKRIHLMAQFMGNSFIQTSFATFLALLLSYLILPWFNSIIGQEIHWVLSLKFILSLLVIFVLTGIIGGIYPALYLSSLKPVSILKKERSRGIKYEFISILVIIQFCIAIFAIIVSGIFVKQLNYMQSKEIGLNFQNMVVVPTGLWYDSKSFKDELLRNPDILSVSASTYAPINCGSESVYKLNRQGTIDSVYTSVFFVDEDFAENYQLEIVKGQFLQMNYDSYWKALKKKPNSSEQEESHKIALPIVINETAEKLFGFDEPIGKRIENNIIVGVVKDFNFQPLHHHIGPLVLMNSPENIMTMNIKISSKDRSQTLKFIGEVYQKYRDQRDFSYQFFDEILESEYQDEIRLKNITTVFSLLALMIALLGIFGMVWLSIRRRTKEIGVRKINGAKTFEIVKMLNRDFLKWVAIAFIIACPIAYYAIDKWLENFAYKTELSWWVFALAGLIAMCIALLTVSVQSWRAATKNPVESLRYE
ncbi:ABC transporter permease [Ancylomarina sp. DW003]|nr:FtsX-like permease family protein [Ancylomarina sp. DW003]MDE5423177.1 ABC transporter permease [Ancylomarina sp. DW003]